MSNTLILGCLLMASQLAFADGPMSTATPTFRGLKADLQANNITSAQGMLHFLATTPEYQALLQSAVLERKSFALHRQHVTDEFPRIVMSSGNLTMHLTTDIEKLGDRLIEVVEFDPAAADLKFDLINFGGTAGTEFYEKADTALLPFDVMSKQTGGSVFNCNACHGGPQGFSNLHWSPLDGLQRVFGTGRDMITKDSEEFSAFQKFLAMKSDPVRGVLFQELKLNFSTDVKGNIVFPDQPNRKFTEHVYETARRKAAASLQKFSGYPNYQFAVAAALMDCPDIEQFLPSDSRATHEQALKATITSPNSGFSGVDALQLQHSDMTDAFWNTYAKEHGTSINEQIFFQYTTLPLMQALTVSLTQINRGIVVRMLPNFIGQAATEYLYNQRIYDEPTYLSRLAKIRYLLYGYVPELPGGVIGQVNEVTQSGKSGFAAQSYRLLGGNRYFAALLAENFGPQFLHDNPALNLFKDGVMSSTSLKVSQGQYCRLLKQKSVNAFVAKPLIKNAVTAVNGDLCGDSIGRCRFPLACLDRGDGVKACVGGESAKGTDGQLCAGLSESSIYFCAPETQCLPRVDGVLTCQAMPAGSGKFGESCVPTHTGFCGPGLVCDSSQTCEFPRTTAAN